MNGRDDAAAPIETVDVLPAAAQRKSASSMNSLVDCLKNGECTDDSLAMRSDFAPIRKKSADDLLLSAHSPPFASVPLLFSPPSAAQQEAIALSAGLSFTSGSTLQLQSSSSSPPTADRRSPSPSPQPSASIRIDEPALNDSPSVTMSAAAVAPVSQERFHESSTPNNASAVASAEAHDDPAAVTEPAEAPASRSVSLTSSTGSTSASLLTAASMVSSSSGAPKGPSKPSERAKKKAWYSVLYPSYKSRTEDFKKLFKDVPDDERLVVDYSCAVQRDILVHGRLYVSQNYLCFHANIFGWETRLSIRWKDVTAITKEKTALVIPNAILVSTGSEKYFITSFTSRDKAYLMLFRVWQNALMDKQMQPQEMWQWVHNCYGEQLGLTSDDEDYIDPYETAPATDGDEASVLPVAPTPAIPVPGQKSGGATTDDQSDGAPRSKAADRAAKAVSLSSKPSSRSPMPSPRFDRRDRRSASPSIISAAVGAAVGVAIASAPSSSAPTGKPPAHRKPKTSLRKQRSTNTSAPQPLALDGSVDQLRHADFSSTDGGGTSAGPLSASSPLPGNAAGGCGCEQQPTDVSDSSDSDEASSARAPFVCTAECTSMHEGRQLVHTILPINVDTLFTLLFSKSKFLVDFHDHRETTNMVHHDWIDGPDGLRQRTVNLTVALKSVGPKCSHVSETQVQRACTVPTQLYSIDITSSNAGIPYADSFYVFMHYCLVRTVDDHTMFSVHAQVKYKKSVWGVVKGFIEKNTWAGLEDFYTALLRALQSEYCIPPAKAKGRPRARGGRTADGARQPPTTLDATGDLAAKVTVGPVSASGGFSVTASVANTGDPIYAASACLVASDGASADVGGPGSRLTAAVSGSACVGVASATASANVRAAWSGQTVWMLLLVGLLVLVNVILYANLWMLKRANERWDDVGPTAGPTMGGYSADYFDLHMLKDSPKSADEWIELLKQQEAMHASETYKWQMILQSAVQLLRKTEQTLSDLLSLIDVKDLTPDGPLADSLSASTISPGASADEQSTSRMQHHRAEL